MSRKIPETKMEEIIILIDSGRTDADIADTAGVSVSYVNKLRNKWAELKAKKSAEKESKSYGDKTLLEDIELLELKIRSLEKTISLYKELIAFKKEILKK